MNFNDGLTSYQMDIMKDILSTEDLLFIYDVLPADIKTSGFDKFLGLA